MADDRSAEDLKRLRGVARLRIGEAITQVLNAADGLGMRYSDAIGYFSPIDWQLICKGEYTQELIIQALRGLQES